MDERTRAKLPIHALCAGLIWLSLSATPGLCGSYLDIVACEAEGAAGVRGCHLGRPQNDHHLCNGCDTNPDQECCFVSPYGIVHPLGYAGEEVPTTLELRICVQADSMELEPAVQRSIATWEDLVPTTGNCHGCGSTGDPVGVLAEQLPPVTGRFFADTAILHELGHCAMGLDHVNRLWDADGDLNFEETSFTRSGEARHPDGMDSGVDGIRGSRDDIYTRPPTGSLRAVSVSWFRTTDNDPFVVDGATIEKTSYSRSLGNLPLGDEWGASGNRRVGDDPVFGLGYQNTQSVMYSLAVRGHYYSDLSADDVNMVKMGMTGRDRLAGPSDDYTIDLVYVGECESNAHDIKVYEGNPGAPDDPLFVPGDLGGCTLKEIDWSYDQSLIAAYHLSMVKIFPATPFEVILYNEVSWLYDDPATVNFVAGFETGDTSEWSSTVQ